MGAGVMGNAASASAANKKRWNWKPDATGRMVPVPVRAKPAAPKKKGLQLKRWKSDNFNLWIFNPDPPRRTNSGKSFTRKTSRGGR